MRRGAVPLPRGRQPAGAPTARLAGAGVRLGFKLLAELAGAEITHNVFISPFSVFTALAMTYNGAAGETAQAMAAVLEVDEMSLDEVNRSCAALLERLAQSGPGLQLSLANSLWRNTALPIEFRPDFLHRAQTFFRARVAALNFGSPGALSAINGWVSAQTNGKIDPILDRLPQLALLYLINAIYFKGDWARPFDRERTQEAPFTLLDGSRKLLPMMSQSGRFDYRQERDFQAIRLPYVGDRISMYILLPAEDSSLGRLMAQLTADRWQDLTTGKRFYSREGTIALPRFKLEYEAGLKKALAALGMGVAFSDQQADFSRMSAIPSPGYLYISRVIHKAFIEVNEEGAEAAAATVVEVMVRGMSAPFEMLVNRPFFCALRDDQTGALLFVGLVVEP